MRPASVSRPPSGDGVSSRAHAVSRPSAAASSSSCQGSCGTLPGATREQSRTQPASSHENRNRGAGTPGGRAAATTASAR
ncbi:hypothetical protein ACIA8R_39695 [Nonomuraea sp. NPDC051191]|uniref:hypothetical protein n=1 Tax=Nonomuraea sp. NPDC051191 TaxID=3364372 RepID=UPI0037A3D821